MLHSVRRVLYFDAQDSEYMLTTQKHTHTETLTTLSVIWTSEHRAFYCTTTQTRGTTPGRDSALNVVNARATRIPNRVYLVSRTTLIT